MTNHKTFEQQTFTLHLNQDGNFTLETSDKIHLKLPSKSVKTLGIQDNYVIDFIFILDNDELQDMTNKNQLNELENIGLLKSYQEDNTSIFFIQSFPIKQLEKQKHKIYCDNLYDNFQFPVNCYEKLICVSNPSPTEVHYVNMDYVENIHFQLFMDYYDDLEQLDEVAHTFFTINCENNYFDYKPRSSKNFTKKLQAVIQFKNNFGYMMCGSGIDFCTLMAKQVSDYRYIKKSYKFWHSLLRFQEYEQKLDGISENIENAMSLWYM